MSACIICCIPLGMSGFLLPMSNIPPSAAVEADLCHGVRHAAQEVGGARREVATERVPEPLLCDSGRNNVGCIIRFVYIPANYESDVINRDQNYESDVTNIYQNLYS